MNPKLLLGFALILSGLNVYSQAQTDTHLTPQAVAHKTLDAYAALSSYSDTGTTVKSEAGAQTTTTFSIRLQRPNLFLILWTQTGVNYTNKDGWWSDGDTNWADYSYFLNETAGLETNAEPKGGWIPLALTVAKKESDEATFVPSLIFQWDIENILTPIVVAQTKSALSDGKIGDVDCHVISMISNPVNRPNFHAGKTTMRLWIGKQDYLIHQIQSTYEPPQTQNSNAPAATTKSGTTVFTQTHENILVNHKFSVKDFEQQRPENHSSITLHSAPPATARLPKLKNILLSVPTNSASLDSDIILLSAEFGMGEKIVDVTARVGKLLCSQPERFIVSAQTLGTDPLPGKKKRLVIRYEYRGSTNILTQPAGHLMSREALSLDADKHN